MDKTRNDGTAIAKLEKNLPIVKLLLVKLLYNTGKSFSSVRTMSIFVYLTCQQRLAWPFSLSTSELFLGFYSSQPCILTIKDENIRESQS